MVELLVVVAIVLILLVFLTMSTRRPRIRTYQVHCINNMKQIGLAARIWSNDHNDTFPPDLITMKNELNTPRILFCPADTKVVRVTEWPELNPSTISYRYLNPNGSDLEPSKPLIICPIHGHVGLGDGSVHRK